MKKITGHFTVQGYKKWSPTRKNNVFFLLSNILKCSLGSYSWRVSIKIWSEQWLTPSSVKRLIKKIKETGSISDLRHFGRPSTNHSTENIAAVREALGTFIRHRVHELDISWNLLQRIISKDFHLHAYQVGLWNNNKCILVFQKKKIFSNAAHLLLDCFLNRQTYRIWVQQIEEWWFRNMCIH